MGIYRRYSIRGVSVQFPFDAYPVQQDFMDRVVQSLQEVGCRHTRGSWAYLL